MHGKGRWKKGNDGTEGESMERLWGSIETNGEELRVGRGYKLGDNPTRVSGVRKWKGRSAVAFACIHAQ